MTSRDERVEAFLQDALSLQDERLAQVREGVRIYIARYEKTFPTWTFGHCAANGFSRSG